MRSGIFSFAEKRLFLQIPNRVTCKRNVILSLDKLPYGKFIPEFGGVCWMFDFFFGGGWRGGPAFDRTERMKHAV